MRFSLPVLLDSLGTFFAIYFCGPLYGVLCSLPVYAVWSYFDATYLPYIIIGAVTGIGLTIIFETKYIKGLISLINAGLMVGIANVVISFFIAIILGEDYIHNVWGWAVYDMFMWNGYGKIVSTAACFLAVELLDKQITAVLAYIVISRFHSGRYERPKWHLKRDKASILMIMLVLGMLFGNLSPLEVKAVDHRHNDVRFVATMYDGSSGMYSSGGNCITQTSDGFIWIGSSAGLTRYDGVNFEYYNETSIGAVNCLLFDTKGRHWVGTNSSGLICYKHANDDEPVTYNVKNGLPANSIRAICEDNQGNIYVATTSDVCYINEEGVVSKPLPDSNAVVSMASKDGVVICVDNTGGIFAYRNGRKIDYYRYEEEELFYNTVAVTSRGVYAGTSENGLVKIELSERYISLNQSVETPLNDITNIMEDSNGRLWICAENGFGYLDSNEVFHDETISGFSSSFSDILEDFQGNIWITSSINGVLKLTRSQFTNVFRLANLDGSIVNAVNRVGDILYIGKDNGLTAIDFASFNVVEDELSDYLSFAKIQYIFEDRDGVVWVGTYTDNVGLVRYDKKNSTIEHYNVYSGLPSGRIRCISQLLDGTIVVGTNGGVAFIENGVVTSKITDEDGLENSQVQDILVSKNGDCYICTDGAGMYVISDKKIVRHIDVNDGIGSNIVLKAYEHEDGIIIVTGASIDYVSGNRVRSIAFPNENNYDIKIVGETTYVMMPIGFYKFDTRELASGNRPDFDTFYLAERLGMNPVRGAQNYVSEDGCVYFCCNNTVLVYHPYVQLGKPTYLYGLESVVAEDNLLVPEADGITYHIPKEANSVEIKASVRNYNLHYPAIKFYVQEFENNAEIVNYDKLSPIKISNLSRGTFHVVLEVYNGTTGELAGKTVYLLKKDNKMWENRYFRFYLLFVFVDYMVYAIYIIYRIRYSFIRRAELENQQEILEKKVKEQTADLLAEKEHTKSVFDQTIMALSGSVDAKDRYTSGHSKRVAKYSRMIAEKMGKSEEELESIYRAGLLHDIGKIRVPAAIINKPGKLTDDEFAVIKLHPVTGYHILKNIADDKSIMLGARYHHERYDGKGYPNGLRGNDIPEVARIIGVADSYDAMTSNRSYRDALPQEVARSEIEKGIGTQFDPEIARIMLEIIDEDSEYEFHEKSMSDNKVILVVDEDKNCFETVTEMLSDEPKYHVIWQESYGATKDYLESNTVDMIILSNVMIDDAAIAFSNKIRLHNANIPVIFATEDKNENNIRMLMRTGMQDFLSKPINKLALKEIVHTVINPY